MRDETADSMCSGKQAGYVKRLGTRNTMQISNKTRKALWGRSGNRCAICRRELVIDATRDDDESVVADECHIISPQPNGPRHDESFPPEQLDAYENLILLCRTHHKMVDDQTANYTSDCLRQVKAKHTVWVSQRLTGGQKPQSVRLRMRNNGRSQGET